MKIKFTGYVNVVVALILMMMVFVTAFALPPSICVSLSTIRTNLYNYLPVHLLLCPYGCLSVRLPNVISFNLSLCRFSWFWYPSSSTELLSFLFNLQSNGSLAFSSDVHLCVLGRCASSNKFMGISCIIQALCVFVILSCLAWIGPN